MDQATKDKIIRVFTTFCVFIIGFSIGMIVNIKWNGYDQGWEDCRHKCNAVITELVNESHVPRLTQWFDDHLIGLPNVSVNASTTPPIPTEARS